MRIIELAQYLNYQKLAVMSCHCRLFICDLKMSRKKGKKKKKTQSCHLNKDLEPMCVSFLGQKNNTVYQ